MHIHILGICGTFMGGVAALAKAAGHKVTGCDLAVYPPMSAQLQQLGIDLIEGYAQDQLALKPDLFVIGNVVSRAKLPDGSAKFPLMEAILDAGLPYISGPQWLSQYVLQTASAPRHVLAVSGTHGKTTTTDMLAWILQQNGLNPGFLIGGVSLNFDVSARLGDCLANAPFVIEADEYDSAFFDKRSKFVHYRPKTLIINNLEFDHADIFTSLTDIQTQFNHLLRTVPSSGLVVYQAGVKAIDEVLQQGCWSNKADFAQQDVNASWQLAGNVDDFAILHNQQQVAKVKWNLTGQHNQLNALAAIVAATNLGINPAQAAEALNNFTSPKRRMELTATIKLNQGGDLVKLYDDFAHHPTAIKTTVSGLKQQLKLKGDTQARVLAIFEPRSNTMKLGAMSAKLVDALEDADLIFCYNKAINWDVNVALAAASQRVVVDDDIDQLVKKVVDLAQPGDNIICMSNGSFAGIQQKLALALAKK